VWIGDDGSLTVQEHNPLHLFTTQLACDYDPEATCPTWDAAIRRVFQDCDEPEEVIRHFYEVFGYILQPTRDTALWVMLWGPGGNGKSFLIRIISELMGRGTVISKSLSELSNGTNTHFTSSLVGKLMLLDDDLKAKTVLPDDWLKKLSEAKLLTADPKFAQAFEFVARCIPVILANHWPSTTDLSAGLRRRIHVFGSKHVLTEAEQDPQHLRIIRAYELPGVLNRLIAGQLRFFARGCRFDPPRECLALKEHWQASSNTTMRFIQDCLEKTEKRTAVRATHLYDHYINWLRYSEVSAKPLGRYKFYEAMESLGLKRTSHAKVAHFSGLRLRPLEGLFDDLDDDGLDL
jgi:putative DNA primase/helicase